MTTQWWFVGDLLVDGLVGWLLGSSFYYHSCCEQQQQAIDDILRDLPDGTVLFLDLEPILLGSLGCCMKSLLNV